MDHILTLRAIMKEVRHCYSKVFCYIVDFRKAFDLVSRDAMFKRLSDIGISEILIVSIMCLYEAILGHLRTLSGLSDLIRGPLG